VDHGIVGVNAIGSSTIDWALYGIWIIDPRTGSRYKIRSSGRSPRWSPDSEYIVFIDDNRLCTMDYHGGQFRQLTSGGWNNHPVWSHDGAMIAYDSDLDVSAGFAIWIMDAYTLDSRRITESGIRFPEWMVGDQRLLSLRGVDDTGQFCSMNTDGGDVQVVSSFLGSTGIGIGDARVSPDGRRIAYSNYIPGNCRRQMWILDAQSGADYRLTWEGGAEPAWSPDGTLIVYVKEDATKSDSRLGTLWIMDSMTGEEWQLTSSWIRAKDRGIPSSK
jgi:Tol biopolymer transport system component